MDLSTDADFLSEALQLDDDVLYPQFNFDFTNLKDDGRVFKRGDMKYKRPYPGTGSVST